MPFYRAVIRYVVYIVDGKRYVLHAFAQEQKAIVEDPATGNILILPAAELRFDPPSEHLFALAQRAHAAGSPPPIGPFPGPR